MRSNRLAVWPRFKKFHPTTSQVQFLRNEDPFFHLQHSFVVTMAKKHEHQASHSVPFRLNLAVHDPEKLVNPFIQTSKLYIRWKIVWRMGNPTKAENLKKRDRDGRDGRKKEAKPKRKKKRIKESSSSSSLSGKSQKAPLERYVSICL